MGNTNESDLGKGSGHGDSGTNQHDTVSQPGDTDSSGTASGDNSTTSNTSGKGDRPVAPGDLKIE